MKYFSTYRPIHESTTSPTRAHARVLCNRSAYFQNLAGKTSVCPSLREALTEHRRERERESYDLAKTRHRKPAENAENPICDHISLHVLTSGIEPRWQWLKARHVLRLSYSPVIILSDPYDKPGLLWFQSNAENHDWILE